MSWALSKEGQSGGQGQCPSLQTSRPHFQVLVLLSLVVYYFGSRRSGMSPKEEDPSAPVVLMRGCGTFGMCTLVGENKAIGTSSKGTLGPQPYLSFLVSGSPEVSRHSIFPTPQAGSGRTKQPKVQRLKPNGMIAKKEPEQAKAY